MVISLVRLLDMHQVVVCKGEVAVVTNHALNLGTSKNYEIFFVERRVPEPLFNKGKRMGGEGKLARTGRNGHGRRHRVN